MCDAWCASVWKAEEAKKHSETREAERAAELKKEQELLSLGFVRSEAVAKLDAVHIKGKSKTGRADIHTYARIRSCVHAHLHAHTHPMYTHIPCTHTSMQHSRLMVAYYVHACVQDIRTFGSLHTFHMPHSDTYVCVVWVCVCGVGMCMCMWCGCGYVVFTGWMMWWR